jgi:adenylate cyclase
MAKDHLSRKLAILLHADVVGSTSLVQKDETLAHERIQDTFRRFSETIAAQGGIAHEIRGDALVAEFTTPSDAVCAAVDFQLANATHIEELQDEIRPIVRIGIAMGEVVVADNTVTGEGIVLAQRLEQLAKPGSVCIQGAVYETVPKRLPFVYENLGNHSLKGFEEPVNAYAVRHESDTTVVETKALSLEAPVGADLSDKPSIAVLPFANMSGDPEQEYFSDGITEDIITELSRFRELYVIARNSTFTFKKQDVDITEVAAKLGVQYVVEGSVRKAGNRVRITVQLVDGATAKHKWADKYDGSLEDIFAVQDDVVASIVRALPNQIRHAELARRVRTPTSIRAYDLYLQGTRRIEFGTLAGFRAGISLLERALDIEPEFAAAHAWLGAALTIEISYVPSSERESTRRKYEWHSRRAVEIDETDYICYALLCDMCVFGLGDIVEGRIYAERALSLAPNASLALAYMGYMHNVAGERELALKLCSNARRLDPLANGLTRFFEGIVLFDVGRYDEAVRAMLTADWGNKLPNLAAAFAMSGDLDKAKMTAARAMHEMSEEMAEEPPEDWAKWLFDNGWYCHGNHDGTLFEGFRLAGF